VVTGARLALSRALRRAALPLGCYYTVTLLLPLLNGAGQSGAVFLAHAAVVAGVPLLVIALACAVERCLGALRSASAGRMGRPSGFSSGGSANSL
jgi:hypothetical protein